MQIQDFKQKVWYVDSHEWVLRGMKMACIVGVNMHERLEKQGVIVNLRCTGEREKEDYSRQIEEGVEMWRRLGRRVCEVCGFYNYPHLCCGVQPVHLICLRCAIYLGR